MKKYSYYNCLYKKKYLIIYYITDITFYPHKKRRVARIKIAKDENTIKHLDLTLEDKMKLNKETEDLIVQYAKDYIDTKIEKEV